MNMLKYYIVSADDAHRLGVSDYRQGNSKKGYLVNSDDFVCATEDFMERAMEVTENDAIEFVKSLQHE